MKDTLLVLLILLAAAAAVFLVLRRRKTSSCCGTSESGERAVPVKDGNYPNRMVRCIDGMVCANCAVRVQNALNSLPGVRARVRYDSRDADISYDDTVTERQIMETVAKAGYILR